AELLESTTRTATGAPISAGVLALTQGVMNAMQIAKFKLVTAVLAVLAAVGLSLGGLGHTPDEEKAKRAPGVAEDDKKPADGQAKIVREKLMDRQGEEGIRGTGKGKVIDGKTVEFGEGARIGLAYGGPQLDQMAMNGDALYPAGKEAAEFLRKLLGERPVTFFRHAEREHLGWNGLVGDTTIDHAMISAGWALAGQRPQQIAEL